MTTQQVAASGARSPAMRHVRRVRILGTGVAARDAMVTSAEMDARLGLPPGTVEHRTGVVSRHVEAKRTAAELGADAARRAIDAAGLGLGDIDCLVAASGTPDQAMPCNAALMQRVLGCGGGVIPAFDVNASCLSFLVALDTLAYLVDADRYRRVLIVSSDIASCGLDWSHLDESGIFGDGAAAIVLGPAEDSGSALVASAFATLSEGAHYCEIKGGGSRYHPSRITEPFAPLTVFRMDGHAVFHLAGGRLAAFVKDLVSASGVPLESMPVVVPHQASAHALRFTRRQLRLRADQMVDIYAQHGNQVAASLPSALHEAIASRRLQRGDHALLIGTGAGVSLGGVVLCY
jgi:3-oxoacyl-[acyl-carrier-protein] synthase-3